MVSLKNRLKLSFFVSVHNGISRLNGWFCSKNFVKKVLDSSFCKAFKNSCNAVAKFLGFKPIFKVVDKNANVIERGYQYLKKETDYWWNWNKIVLALEALKLETTKLIFNSIDSWHKDINKKSIKEMSTSEIERNVSALCSLNKSTEKVLNYFDSVKKPQSGWACFTYVSHDREIDDVVNRIREKHTLIEEEISSRNNEIKGRVSGRARGAA